MSRAGPPATLARHYLRWLLALFLGWTVSIFAAVLGFVMLPMAERSADDLAGLMVLSAQTWVELPPDTRPAFEAELLRMHQLAVVPGLDLSGGLDPVHGFYAYYLEQSLRQRGGLQAHLAWAPGPEPGNWLWTTVQAGGQDIGVGFSDARLNTRPLWALSVVLLVGTAQAGGVAWWLARRISRPVARLERAAAELAGGARPALLPTNGPRELAELAGHFNQMVLQVRELLDARTTLLAGISHDLRTPLARMRLALELLTVAPRPDLVARMERDVDEMNSLIGQLLDLARGLEHEPARSFDLAPWLAERVARHAELARERGATITLSCAADVHVHGAAGALGRLIDNLLGNALRYAPGPIELVAQAQPGPGPHRVRLSVLDRGPGIPAEHMAAIWRPFQRVEGSRNPGTGGYGLGLAIVRQLANRQGWTVGMAAREGGGLVVWVDLPADETTGQPGQPDAVGA